MTRSTFKGLGSPVTLFLQGYPLGVFYFVPKTGKKRYHWATKRILSPPPSPPPHPKLRCPNLNLSGCEGPLVVTGDLKGFVPPLNADGGAFYRSCRYFPKACGFVSRALRPSSAPGESQAPGRRVASSEGGGDSRRTPEMFCGLGL